VKVKEHCQFKTWNSFAALENFGGNVDIIMALESIKENMKMLFKLSLGYYKLKQHKSWLDEECSEVLDQRKQN
jgi:hypothetical protein